MTVDTHAIRVLQPVIACARTVLADMERDDVPAALRRVAKSSARTLPPPYAKSLVRELVANTSLRESVAEQYDGTDPDLVAFLAEPETALGSIAERASASREEDEAAALAVAQSRIATLEDQITTSKKRTAELRTTHKKDLDEARLTVSEGRERAEARITNLQHQLDLSQTEIDTLAERVKQLSEELHESETRRGSITARQRRRDNATASDPGPRSDATPSDPVELARWLDAVERRIRPFRAHGRRDPSGADYVPLAIDKGVSPDSGVVLDVLIAQKPSRFILDGYNIGGEIDATGFSTRRARDDVVARAGRLARKAASDVLVVFDGPDDDGRSGFRTADGVAVTFSKGIKADDVIVDLVYDGPAGTVVITNDRDLRTRCTVPGCVPIWSTAFLEWLKPGS